MRRQRKTKTHRHYRFVDLAGPTKNGRAQFSTRSEELRRAPIEVSTRENPMPRHILSKCAGAKSLRCMGAYMSGRRSNLAKEKGLV